MLISAYDAFVQKTDRSQDLTPDERFAIAVYGLASEVGSVVGAIKKRLLAGAGSGAWNRADKEVVEELGDVMWYCFSLARVANPGQPINIFAHDIANLRAEIGGISERAAYIARVLDHGKRDEFLIAAAQFPKSTRKMTFDHYQDLAFLTARTSGITLARVCLAVLWQLSAQLLRKTLPPVELALNKSMIDREINDLLGEIAWHVSALSSLFELRLNEVAEANQQKVMQRWDRSIVTPLHDDGRIAFEQFPRLFEVVFVQVNRSCSRMYLNGRERLGNDLTDNSYDDDGYRYHDVMHLAHAARLGWSPVLRGLMKRKRKSDPVVDEVEDGARAQIVEEAVIKAIHSEGERLAELRHGPTEPGPQRLFAHAGEVSYSLLKLISTFVADLEVSGNRYSEWEGAIVDGYSVFHQLRCEGQGTVTVDLERRCLTFSPEVFLDIPGRVVGIGSAIVDIGDDYDASALSVRKEAILSAIGIPITPDLIRGIDLSEDRGRDLLSLRPNAEIRSVMWDRGAVTFRTTITEADQRLHATAIALADD